MATLSPGTYTFGVTIAPGNYVLRPISGKGHIGFSRTRVAKSRAADLYSYDLKIPETWDDNSPFPDEVRLETENNSMLIVTGTLMLSIERARAIGADERSATRQVGERSSSFSGSNRNKPRSYETADAVQVMDGPAGVGNAIRAAWGSRGLTSADWAQAVGMTESQVEGILSLKNIPSDLLIAMLSYAGYQLIAAPTYASLPAGFLLLDQGLEPDSIE